MDVPWGDGPHYCAGAESYGCEAMLDEDEGSYCDECWERMCESILVEDEFVDGS